MHRADYAVARCPSVRLSHAGIVPKRLLISSKFFSPSGSPTILVMTHSVDSRNTNRDLHMLYSTVLFRMTLSELNDLANYSMTRSVARSLCDS